MRTNLHDKDWWNYEWTRLAAFICLALTLAAAALDRRNAVLDRIEAPPGRAGQTISPPTPDAMVRDMMEHD